MGWWSRAKSAVKSAVSKAVSTVKSVASSVSRAVSNTVSRVTSAVKSVASSVSRSVSNAVSKASSAVSSVANTVKTTVSNVVNNVKDSVAVVADAVTSKVRETIQKITYKIEEGKAVIQTINGKAVDAVSDLIDKAKEIATKSLADRVKEVEERVKVVKDFVKETAEKVVEKVKEKIEEAGWKERLLKAAQNAALGRLPFGVVPQVSSLEMIYAAITEKRLTPEEGAKLQLKIVDWIVPMNVLSKLFYGKNLEGKEEEFGGFGDYAELVLAFAIFIPAGAVTKVGAKLGLKVGTKLGLKGFMKFAVTKIDDAAKLFTKLNVDDQAKLLGKLSKTDEGIKIINLLLGKKALHKTLVKPTISIVNKEITRRILTGKGFAGLISRALRPKTILWGLTGMLGLVGSVYGVTFGTEWFAKEGLWELYSFPITDKLRDYRYDPTPEKAERIRKEIDKCRSVLPKAQALVRNIAWLWPFTKDAWLSWADGIEFELQQIEEEFGAIIVPELVVLPETIKGMVRDIIDGDTLDVSLDAIDQATGAEIKLAEYQKSGHARIRVVGINAPEKSPKGEILCSDVEIFNVEKEFADLSRDRLLPLNDKEVILKIDPENAMDTFGRILAVVEFGGEDIGLRQIKEGLACGYYRGSHKYYDEAVYSAETLAAKAAGVGMWRGLEEVEKEEEKIKIRITSTPDNAKLYLDDVALRHNTPSDEVELSDMLHLFTLGKHVLSAEKAGLSAMEDIVIVKGDNGTINLDLVSEPFPEAITEEEVVEEEIKEELVEEEIEEKEIEEEVVPKVEGLVAPAEIPKEYTAEQMWALKEAFTKVLELTEGTAIMSKKEREDLFAGFAFYTDGQKEVIKLLMRDITFYTEGTKQLSGDEFILLKEKYRVLET